MIHATSVHKEMDAARHVVVTFKNRTFYMDEVRGREKLRNCCRGLIAEGLLQQLTERLRSTEEWISPERLQIKQVREASYCSSMRRVLHVTVDYLGGLKGGKGGFGATLKASGRNKSKVTRDFGACRDLNGRRLRAVNNDIRIELIKQQLHRKKLERSQGKKTTDSTGEFEKLDRDTKSGVQGWHLGLPLWAEGAKKMIKRRQRKKIRCAGT